MQSVLTGRSILATAGHWYPAGLEHLPAAVMASSVRWRKNRMVPKNKNKLFIIAEHPMYSKGESDELLRLHNKYSTHVKSTRLFLKELYNKQSDTSEAALKEAHEEERQHTEMMAYNRLENERMAVLREKRIQMDLDHRLEHIVETKMKKRAKEEEERKEALALLQQTEEFVKTFIDPEDLMSALETAYDNPVDYNYAIDSQGFVYPGRETKPDDVDELRHISDPKQPSSGAVCKQQTHSKSVWQIPAEQRGVN